MDTESSGGPGHAEGAPGPSSRAARTRVESSYPPPAIRELGRFKIRAQLGEGAFGRVYRAHDPILDREVALKVPILPRGNAEATERFVIEAKAAASLRHENIVATFESGQADGCYYIAYEYVAGRTLSRHIGDGPVPLKQALGWIRDLADAVAYAHDHGILHRDIKPSNVMIDSTGRPHLMDFGLAKLQRSDESMTVDGALMGTPAYMSPEQARGETRGIGPAADQYSLGVVFYELLTGKVPFAGSMGTVLGQVANPQLEATAPAKLDAAIPSDVEACCLKAIEKDPLDRYGSVHEFGRDLDRILRDEPTNARPLSRIERVVRWRRRNPLVAGLVATIALLLVAGIVGTAVAAVGFRSEANKARLANEETRATLSEMYARLGIAAADDGNDAAAITWFANAARLAGPQAAELHRIRFANWSRELAHPTQAWVHDGLWLEQLDMQPRGRHVLARCAVGRCAIWNLDDGRPLAWPEEEGLESAAWSADGTRVALGGADAVNVYTFPRGARLASLTTHAPATALAFSPDRSLLAIGSDRLRIYDMKLGQFVSQAYVHDDGIPHVAFDRTGTRLMTGCEDGTARVFSVSGLMAGDGPTLSVPNVRGEGLHEWFEPLFLDGGTRILARSATGAATRWDLASGDAVDRIELEPLYRAATSEDGRFVVLCGNPLALLWDTRTAPAEAIELAHGNAVIDASFAPDASELVTVSSNNAARLWSVPDGRRLTVVPHDATPTLVAHGGEPGTFVTSIGGATPLVRAWRLDARPLPGHRIPSTSHETFVRTNRDASLVVCAGWDLRRDRSAVQVHDMDSGGVVGPRLETGAHVNAAAFADGDRLLVVLASEDGFDGGEEPLDLHLRGGQIQFWDWRTGSRLGEPLAVPVEPVGLDTAPDGHSVIVPCADGSLLRVDVGTRSFEELTPGGRAWMLSRYLVRDRVRFGPRGERFVVWGGRDRYVDVWNARTGEREHRFRGAQPTCDVRFSPDGERIAAARIDQIVAVWNVTTGATEAELSHGDVVFTARFNDDGTRLLTASRDGAAHLWDWRAGERVCPPFPHTAEFPDEAEVHDAVFVPGTPFVVTGSRAGKIRAWETISGKPISPELSFAGSAGREQRVYQLVVTPDGARLLAAGQLDELPLLELDHLFRAARVPSRAAGARTSLDDELVAYGELLSGRRVLGDELVDLTATQWLESWRELDSPGEADDDSSD